MEFMAWVLSQLLFEHIINVQPVRMLVSCLNSAVCIVVILTAHRCAHGYPCLPLGQVYVPALKSTIQVRVLSVVLSTLNRSADCMVWIVCRGTESAFAPEIVNRSAVQQNDQGCC